MNPPNFLFIVLAAVLVPAITFTARDSKPRKRPGADAPPAVSETARSYDKNGNRQIDPDELAAMQKTFTELRQLDKNGNGEIEASEVAPPKPAVASDRMARAMAGIAKVDKNGNKKIDDDEIEALQKALAGGRIMQRLDQNGDGKLEAKEVARLNERLAQGGFRTRGARPESKTTTPAPSTQSSEKPKTAEPKKEELKKEEPKKDEAKKDAADDLTKDPFLPSVKPPGGFGTKE